MASGFAHASDSISRPSSAPEVAASLARGVAWIWPPVQTPFGWHVIEVTDTRPRVVPPYDRVKVRIRETLQKQAEQAKGS